VPAHCSVLERMRAHIPTIPSVLPTPQCPALATVDPPCHCTRAHTRSARSTPLCTHTHTHVCTHAHTCIRTRPIFLSQINNLKDRDGVPMPTGACWPLRVAARTMLPCCICAHNALLATGCCHATSVHTPLCRPLHAALLHLCALCWLLRMTARTMLPYRICVHTALLVTACCHVTSVRASHSR
jgi:hypothetical protein